MAVAAACLFITVSAGGAWLYLSPAAFISIDINPSLELGINRFDQVISVEYFNRDGQNLAEHLDIRYMDYNAALDKLLSEQSVEACLTDGAVMAVTVAGSDDEKTSQILENVKTCTAGHSNIVCHSGSMEEMHEAHSEGLSLGKYRAYLELKELDPTITPDDIRNLSMREIRDLIDAFQPSDANGDTAGNNPKNTENTGSGPKGNGSSGKNKGHGRRHGAGNRR